MTIQYRIQQIKQRLAFYKALPQTDYVKEQIEALTQTRKRLATW